MIQKPSDNREDVIRITTDEAYSEHVDDLLKRQASLRGEQGITRDRKRRWYYQNWFVFMIAGALSATVAWGLLEPSFDDYLYIEGEVERLSVHEQVPNYFSSGGEYIQIEVQGTGWVEVNDERIWLLESTKVRSDGETGETFDANSLEVGERIGVYVDYHEIGADSLALAGFVVPDVEGSPDSGATASLRDLSARHEAASLLVFPLVAALVGLGIGTADGLVCRLWRRVLLGGLVGLLVGFVGGFISSLIAELIYAPLTAIAFRQTGDVAAGLSTFGFFLQMCGRSLAWCAAGMAMGLGQGIALRSGRLVLYGFLGGLIGGLLGGMLFDPLDMLLLGGLDAPSAHWARFAGFLVVGATVGAMIGIVELLARDAWLRMTAGPLVGKEFLIFKDIMKVGASPRSDIYLFNDADVLERHAVIRAVGDNYEIDSQDQKSPVFVNGRPTARGRLYHGDQIGIGRTTFVFQKRRG